MRITQNTIFNNMRHNLVNNTARVLNAQETVTTQKRINRLSDNPLDGGRVLDLNGAISRSQQYLSNIDRAKSQADTQDTTLGQVGDILARAKTLLLAEANSATSTAATRAAARLQISGLTSQLIQLANTRLGGNYIFSGFAVDTPAFADAGVSVTPPAIAGRAAVTAQRVADATQMSYHNYSIQFTSAGQYDVVDTTSGATIAANQSYTSGGLIRFDGMEIRISDSPAVPAAGDVFTVNTTAPGTYQGDSQVQDVEVQRGLYVRQNIPGNRVFQGTGVSGGVDIFSVMNQINAALRTNDQTAISDLLGKLDAGSGQISSERAAVGGRVILLGTVRTNQDDAQSNLETLRSSLEDADLAEAMTELSKQQTTYEAALSAAAKIVQPSLLDFLR